MRSTADKWVDLAYHRAWLINQASDLFAFFERNSRNPEGGFHVLDTRGEPVAGAAGQTRELHATSRMVHSFAIARLMGRPGADAFIDHGMDYLWRAHRDADRGGYFWSVNDDGAADGGKQAYGHAFVLLAAASAHTVGHPDAQRLLDDVSEIIAARFWETERGLSAEEFDRDWQPVSSYRGQNSNMHLAEACMAAHEATGETRYLDMATSIAEFLIRDVAPANGGRPVEHFTVAWEVDRAYAGGDHFRPFGTTPGHWLEWSRLCLQLWELSGRTIDWIPQAATALFDRAVGEAWRADGGFYYTLDWDGQPKLRNRLWWPCAEGIGAAAFLNAIDGDARFETWYRHIWDFVAGHLIDREHGCWRTEPVDQTVPLFEGKPDIYHALQACLIPLLPTTGTVTKGLIGHGVSTSV
ncbi:MAG: AGE family epimerase/isomerase [Alphaproteobacteria bacterium]